MITIKCCCFLSAGVRVFSETILSYCMAICMAALLLYKTTERKGSSVNCGVLTYCRSLRTTIAAVLKGLVRWFPAGYKLINAKRKK